MWSKTTLTGESWFHIIPPWGLNSGPSWWEAKGWPTGPMILCVNAVRLQALNRAPPQQPTVSVVKPEGGPEANMKPGQKSCVRSSGIITLSAWRPSDSLGRSPPQTRPQWSITLESPMWRDNSNRRIPVSHKYPPGDWTPVLHDGRQRVDPLDQWDCVWMQWDCRLSTNIQFLFGVPLSCETLKNF